jgi:hypothetical protein
MIITINKEGLSMESLIKKITIFSMVGMLQVGFGASVIEASPIHMLISRLFN